MIRGRRPDLAVEHIGSTAVPGLPGKGIVDLSIEIDPGDDPGGRAILYELGFGPQPGPDPWPPTRPMLVGALELDGDEYRIHLHVQPAGGDIRRDIAFRDALRNDPELKRQYTELKTAITGGSRSMPTATRTRRRPGSCGVYRRLGLRACRRSRRRRRSGSSAAGSSAGCSRWRRASSVTGSWSSTRIRPAPRRPSPTASRSAGYDDVEAARRLAAGVRRDHL